MPPPEPRRRRLARRVKKADILPATVMVLMITLFVAGLLWVVFTRLLRDAWPWQVGGLETTTPTPGFQTTQLVLTLVGGVGAAILVVVAYRRQRDLELARFDERFAAAAAQLGAPTAAERLAGVYAMAALADTWEKHRQQCIDVLCGYLRLPYDPTNALLTTVVSEHTWPIGTATGRETRTYEQLPNDRQVRLTIISTITRHLRDPSDGGAPTSWQGHDLDFTGATFDGGDFSRANFSGLVAFDRAEFTGGQVTFDEAKITRGAVTFNEAKFTGCRVTFERADFADVSWVAFDRAEFTGGEVRFYGAQFTGGRVSFDGAQFTGGRVGFYGAQLTGGTVSFTASYFTGGTVSFLMARFSGGTVLFRGAVFSGGTVTFADAILSGGAVEFVDAVFSGSRLVFTGATLSGAVIAFDRADFTGNRVSFSSASFSDGAVTFDGAQFDGGNVTFNAAAFTGGRVTRDGAEFRGWPPPDPGPDPAGPGAG
jgi:uncharacterized protein YjbI with pentapeptide repeats